MDIDQGLLVKLLFLCLVDAGGIEACISARAANMSRNPHVHSVWTFLGASRSILRTRRLQCPQTQVATQERDTTPRCEALSGHIMTKRAALPGLLHNGNKMSRCVCSNVVM